MYQEIIPAAAYRFSEIDWAPLQALVYVKLEIKQTDSYSCPVNLDVSFVGTELTMFKKQDSGEIAGELQEKSHKMW